MDVCACVCGRERESEEERESGHVIKCVACEAHQGYLCLRGSTVDIQDKITVAFKVIIRLLVRP